MNLTSLAAVWGIDGVGRATGEVRLVVPRDDDGRLDPRWSGQDAEKSMGSGL